METNKLISFSEKKEELQNRDCHHTKIQVSRIKAYVKCGNCGLEMDPLGYLIDISNQENKARFLITELHDELDEKIKFINRLVNSIDSLLGIYSTIQNVVGLKKAYDLLLKKYQKLKGENIAS